MPYTYEKVTSIEKYRKHDGTRSADKLFPNFTHPFTSGQPNGLIRIGTLQNQDEHSSTISIGISSKFYDSDTRCSSL